MILTQRIGTPNHSHTEIALAGLSVKAALTYGSWGNYLSVAADPPYSAYTDRQTLPIHPTFRLPAAGTVPLPAKPTLRLPLQTAGFLLARVTLAAAAALPSRTPAKAALAGLSVSGVLMTGATSGYYSAIDGDLYQPPPPPPAPLPLRVLNFSNTIPAPLPGTRNIQWQADGGTNPRNVSAYVPLAASGGPGLVALSGDLAGSATAPKVSGLQGVTVAAATPGDGQVLTYSAAAAAWQPKASSGGGAPSGSFAILANGSTVAASGAGGFTLAVNGTTVALYS